MSAFLLALNGDRLGRLVLALALCSARQPVNEGGRCGVTQASNGDRASGIPIAGAVCREWLGVVSRGALVGDSGGYDYLKVMTLFGESVEH